MESKNRQACPGLHLRPAQVPRGIEGFQPRTPTFSRSWVPPQLWDEQTLLTWQFFGNFYFPIPLPQVGQDTAQVLLLPGLSPFLAELKRDLPTTNSTLNPCWRLFFPLLEWEVLLQEWSGWTELILPSSGEDKLNF